MHHTFNIPFKRAVFSRQHPDTQFNHSGIPLELHPLFHPPIQNIGNMFELLACITAPPTPPD